MKRVVLKVSIGKGQTCRFPSYMLSQSCDFSLIPEDWSKSPPRQAFKITQLRVRMRCHSENREFNNSCPTFCPFAHLGTRPWQQGLHTSHPETRILKEATYLPKREDLGVGKLHGRCQVRKEGSLSPEHLFSIVWVLYHVHVLPIKNNKCMNI